MAIIEEVLENKVTEHLADSYRERTPGGGERAAATTGA